MANRTVESADGACRRTARLRGGRRASGRNPEAPAAAARCPRYPVIALVTDFFGHLPLPLSILLGLLLLCGTGYPLLRRFRPREAEFPSEAEAPPAELSVEECFALLSGNLRKLVDAIDPERFPEAHRILSGYLENLTKPFLLVVFGEFNAGKSSFINAFLGSEILRTGILPTTATINLIEKGPPDDPLVTFRDGREERMSMAQLDDLSKKDPLSISHVTWTFPAERLAEVRLVDTPGLNSVFEEHESATLDFIDRADAILWLFHPHQGGSDTERTYLERIKKLGKSVIGIISHKDALTPEELEQLSGFLQTHFGAYLETLLPLSALEALSARKSEDAGALAASGMAAIEAYLEKNLFERVHRAKIEATIRSIQAILGTLREELAREEEEVGALHARIQRLKTRLAQEGGRLERELRRRTARTVRQAMAPSKREILAEIERAFHPPHLLWTLLRRGGRIELPLSTFLSEETFREGETRLLEKSRHLLEERWNLARSALLIDLKIEAAQGEHSHHEMPRGREVGELVLPAPGLPPPPGRFPSLVIELGWREILRHPSRIGERRETFEQMAERTLERIARQRRGLLLGRLLPLNRRGFEETLESVAPWVLGPYATVAALEAEMQRLREGREALERLGDLFSTTLSRSQGRPV
ncbi:MAG: hypothetical protein D6812_16060 [Deltaproteobacteria bacterium]|nr:MAG: hypothetical protein D6812_16060 [Deltaproteobacteria bacterium]